MECWSIYMSHPHCVPHFRHCLSLPLTTQTFPTMCSPIIWVRFCLFPKWVPLVITWIQHSPFLKNPPSDMFHALGRFIFKRPFGQNIMIYGTSEYCAWLFMLWCIIWQGVSMMKLFEPHENRQKPTRILDPGFAGSAGSLAFFSKFWFGKRKNWMGCERGIWTP